MASPGTTLPPMSTLPSVPAPPADPRGHASRTGRLGRVVHTALSAFGLCAVFAIGTTAGLVAHLDQPTARRAVAQIVNKVLAPSFKGTLVIDKIDRVALLRGQLQGIDAHLIDADGVTVLIARGVSAQVSLSRLLQSLPGKGAIQIVLSTVRINAAEGTIREDAAGNISIATAFDPRTPDPPGTPPGRDIEVTLNQLSVGHVWAHGAISNQPIDADVDALAGAFHFDKQALTASVQRFPFHARALPIPAREADGFIEAVAALPSNDADPRRITATTELRVGEVRATVVAGMSGDRVEAHVVVPRVAGDAFTAVADGIPVVVSMGATVDVSGELSALKTKAHVDVGEGKVDLVGSLNRTEKTDAEVTADITHVTLQDVAPGSPTGSVDAHVNATMSLDANNALFVRYAVSTAPTTIAEQPVPALVTSGTYDGVHLTGTADVAEPGAQTKVAYAIAPERTNPAVRGLDVDVVTSVPNLSRVPRIGAPIGGSATVHASGHLTLDDTLAVNAQASVQGRGIQSGTNHVSAVAVEAKVHGTINAPLIQASVRAQGIQAGGQDITNVSLQANGTKTSAQVSVDGATANGDKLSATARVLYGATLGAQDIHAKLLRNNEEVRVDAGAVRVQNGAVSVDDVDVHGAGGDIQASIRSDHGTLRVKLHAKEIQLDRLAMLAKHDTMGVEGVTTIDVDLTTSATTSKGTVKIAAHDLKAGKLGRPIEPESPPADPSGVPVIQKVSAVIGTPPPPSPDTIVRPVSLNVEATFDDRNVTLHLDGDAPDLGTLAVDTKDAKLGGGLLDPASFTRATGTLTLLVDAADLTRIAQLLPDDTLPVSRIAGGATINANVSRSSQAAPDVTASISTRSLVVEMPDTEQQPGVRIKDIDLDLRASYAAAKAMFALDLSGKDVKGDIATVHAESKLPVEQLLREADRRREILLATPFEFRTTMARRALKDLPAPIRVTGVEGDVSFDITASGTARDPKVHIAAEAHGIEKKKKGVPSTPIDVRVDGGFGSSRGDLLVDVSTLSTPSTLGAASPSATASSASSPSNAASASSANSANSPSATGSVVTTSRTLVTAKTSGTLEIADLIDGRAGGPRWTGGSEITLSAVPLRMLATVMTQPIAGCASGVIKVSGLHEDAKVDADVRVDGMRIGQVTYRDVTLAAHTGGGKATADVKIEQTDGSLHASGNLGLNWGAALVPSLDNTATADVALDAKGFRLSVLRPFVRDIVGNIDGYVDANVRYRIQQGDALHGKMDGQLSVRDTVIDAPMIGQELRAIQATITATPEGDIKLTNASLRGISGRVSIEGGAHLDGWQLRDANAAVRIARKESMVLTYEGVEIGDAWGAIDVTAKAGEKGALALDVSVPQFDLELPDTQSRSTQKLDDDDTIRVGTRTDDRFVSLPIHKPDPPKKALPDPNEAPSVGSGVISVRVALGRAVRVHHQGLVDAWASGGIQANVDPVAGKTAISGTINVDRGYVEIQGRRFDIESATASFDPSRPPDDPTIRATAAYAAPESIRIIADFSGSVSAGKLTLHSEPSLSQGEILSLIVFGTRDGAVTAHQNSADPNNAARAASVGGGVVTQGLNKALEDIAPVDITTRVDTSDSQNPRPEIAVAISRKVSASVGYRLGVPTPGQNPDRSTLSIEYRFLPKWSLETSVGDAGTSIVDLMWKMRY